MIEFKDGTLKDNTNPLDVKVERGYEKVDHLTYNESNIFLYKTSSAIGYCIDVLNNEWHCIASFRNK